MRHEERPEPTGGIRTALEPALTSVSAARRFVRDVLTSRHVPTDTVDVAELLTSEVVTNALVHTRRAEELVVRVEASHVRIEVTDSDSRVPVRRSVPPDAVAGRGLAIVNALASAWGVDRVGHDRKRVWFKVAR